ncbi:MAG: arsenate reductase ArsC [Candidatus Marinimicrobia bacterium]|nr:arsenate reductase ArsC [Candidatus Neomarinimicrobiota bacterium]
MKTDHHTAAPTRVLILCTGNSCRSQMAEAFVRRAKPDWEVYSAGTFPADGVHPLAIKVMAEAGLDLSSARPVAVENYLDQPFDYIITVCHHAKENCPVFSSQVEHRLHLGFPDPAEATGTDEVVLAVFREVRDEIEEMLTSFAKTVGTG